MGGTDITYQPSDLAKADAAYWATRYHTIQLQAGAYSFEGREYLREPMSTRFRRLCMMKGTQGGASVTVQFSSFHGMIYKRFPLGVLYMFPTTDSVHEYSRATLGPLLAMNRNSIGKFVKNVKGGTDTTSLKQVNGANFFLRGASLAKVINEQHESDKLKGISVDRVVFDEIELMDLDAVEKAKGRMGASKVKEEVYLGNPGIPGRGIDEIFQQSDQRHWFRKCSHCGEWTCAELSFPDCVKIRPDGTGFVGCNKCGQEVFVRDGQWVAQVRDHSDYMHGYRWSHLSIPHNDPAEILDDFTNPPHNNIGDVYRLRLGLPYISSEEQLTTSQVLSRCGPFVMGAKDTGPCAFGLDVGKVKHLVIGKRTGTRSFEIVKAVRLSDWGDIEQMIDKFNCKSGVVDARPYEDEARRFQKEMKHIRIFLCEYSETTAQGTQWNPHTRMVKINRTEAFDATHHLVATDGLLSLPRFSPEIAEFARQLCEPAKVLEENKRTKQMLYRYRGKNDHYRNALNYFLMAAEKIGRATPRSRRGRKHETVMNDYARI